ncbi:MAG: 4-(cytidine 5'-diphospho)-2-C-methyl-D-erythritol kinase [Opitutales bacterium]
MDVFSSDSQTVWEGLSPAKVNLYLAVTGKRADGFHDLVSLVSKLDWGDFMRVELLEREGPDLCEVDHPDCPSDDRNLAVKAVRLFREKVPELPCVSLNIQKRIPMGAGLGGGSSNASTCLLALNSLMNDPLSGSDLHELAAELGSDCPVFLNKGPYWMRGRGEILEPASPALQECLKGRAITVFRPPFGVETPWAYGKLAERGDYRDAESAEADAQIWNEAPVEALKNKCFNSFESPLKEKFIAYIALFQSLSSMGAQPMISGSGSACFFLDDESAERNAIYDVIKDAWGSESILSETILA